MADVPLQVTKMRGSGGTGSSELGLERGEAAEAKKRERRERSLDETVADTFPASDPLSSDPAPERPDDGEEQQKIAS